MRCLRIQPCGPVMKKAGKAVLGICKDCWKTPNKEKRHELNQTGNSDCCAARPGLRRTFHPGGLSWLVECGRRSVRARRRGRAAQVREGWNAGEHGLPHRGVAAQPGRALDLYRA